MTTFTLCSITIYPIKSLAGIHVNNWPVISTGLLYDRKWMLVDSEGQFLSQRTVPDMVFIKTALDNNQLIISVADREDLLIPLVAETGETIPCTIWHDQCLARSVSKKADIWFSEFLNQACRLVYLPEEEIRRVDPKYARATDKVVFTDGYPFLIIAENSLNHLNEKMQLNLPMSRFRPNLVISGCPSYEEDSWREIRIGGIDFRLPKPCSRCTVPTIDPITAKYGKEPLTTLAKLRKWQHKIYFGQNALHNQCGTLTVGDSVKVISTGERQPPLSLPQ